MLLAVIERRRCQHCNAAVQLRAIAVQAANSAIDLDTLQSCDLDFHTLT